MRLTILDFGLFQVHQNGRIIGIPGYLVESDGARVLVDTGFPPQYAADPEGAARDDGLDSFGRVLRLGAQNLPASQLRLVGLRPADVTHLVLTHSHIDHVGHLDAFPNAQIVVGRAEREQGPPLYWGDRRPLQWPPAARYLLIDGDTDLLPGIRLLATPGHSPGHLSLLLALAQTGPVLLTADAISRPAEVEEDRFGGAWDEAQARRSAHRILAIANDLGAWVVYGHDPAQWPTLRKAPEWYG